MISGPIGVNSGAVSKCFLKAMRMVTGSSWAIMLSLSLVPLVIVIPFSLIAAQAPRSAITAPCSSNTRSGLTRSASDLITDGSLSRSETVFSMNWRDLRNNAPMVQTSTMAPTIDQTVCGTSSVQAAMNQFAFGGVIGVIIACSLGAWWFSCGAPVPKCLKWIGGTSVLKANDQNQPICADDLFSESTAHANSAAFYC